MAENSPLLLALKSSRTGVVLTTVALVALTSGTTGVLVAHGTKQLQPRTTIAAPPAQVPVHTTPVVVDRAPGSLAPRPAQLPRRAPQQPSTPRPVLPPVAPPVVAPPAAPPVVAPPVAPPTVVLPPVVLPPVAPPVVPPDLEPPLVRPALSVHGKTKQPHGTPSSQTARSADPQGGKAHQDNGKHLGQEKHGR